MSTIKVNTLTTLDGTGNITLSRPLSGSGASLTSLPAANLTGTLPAIDGSNLTGVAPTKAAVEALGIDLPAANLTGTVADARFPATLPASSGVNLTALNASNISSGTLPIARIADDAVTNAKMADDAIGVAQLSATGTASSSTFLRGDNAWAASGATVSASDPAIDTNATLGTQWANSTSGEFYICTDATTDENVWTNVGAGTGDIQPVPPFQGSIAGYTYGGYNGPAARTAGYEKHSFTSDGNSTDVGNMASGNPGRSNWAGCSSETHGYQCAGYGPGSYSPNTTNAIEKHSFVAEGNCVDVGDLVNGPKITMSSTSFATHGYCAGGYRAVNDPSGAAAAYDDIERFAYASDGNSVDCGDLVTTRNSACGHSDVGAGYGYIAGGHDGGYSNRIERYAHASNAFGADLGDLTSPGSSRSASCSETHGYLGGGYEGQTSDVIEKYAFGSSSNATDVGNLIHYTQYSCGVSSTTHGYNIGGGWSGALHYSNYIMKFSFTTDGNATDVGDLTVAVGGLGRCGTQY